MNSPTPHNRSIRPRALVIVLCAFLAHVHAWEDIFAISTRDPEASHILLVPIVFGYLAWSRRKRIENVSVRGFRLGYVLILLSIVLHIYCMRAEVIIGWHFAAVLGLIGGLVASFGRRLFTDFAPALFALLFLIPIPGLIRQQLSTPVQLACATIATRTLAPLGLDIGQHGCLLTVNGTDVAIAEACNGMRILCGVMLVVYTVAFSIPLRKRLRVLILLLSPVLSIGLNLLRLLATVAMFGLVDEPAAQAFHDVNGWLIPVLIMAGAVIIMEKRRLTPCRPTEVEVTRPQTNFEHPLATGFAAFALLSFPVLQIDKLNSAEMIAVHHRVISEELDQIPFAIDDWLATESPLGRQEAELLQPLAAFRRTYRRPGEHGEVTLVLIACSQARDLVGHEPGLCLTRQGWSITHQQPAEWLTTSRRIQGSDYSFANESWPDLERRVASILITFGRTTSGDPSVVAAAAADFRRNSLGAVGIQIVCDHAMTDAEWHSVCSAFVTELQPLVAQFRAFPRTFYEHEESHEID